MRNASHDTVRNANVQGGLGVHVRGVSHIFDGMQVIQQADLQVEPGGFLAIVGDSGGGKTTLLRLIGGLLAPTRGEIVFTASGEMKAGESARGTSSQSTQAVAQTSSISFCFQEGRLLPWRNVLDNVALPLELNGVLAHERRSAAREMLAKMQLSDSENKMPAQLSGGMRMRVAMARALVTRPKLLLLDEPFGALDEVTRLALDEELRQLWLDTGTTAILVTHSIQEAVSLAQQVVVMRGKPGRTMQSIAIDLPKDPAHRTNMQFVSLCERVYQQMTLQSKEVAGVAQ
jgi:NitT/TauT family transport system ATP-binding protein